MFTLAGLHVMALPRRLQQNEQASQSRPRIWKRRAREYSQFHNCIPEILSISTKYEEK